MTIEQFKIIINTLEEEQEKSLKLYKLGVELNQYSDSFFKVINILLESTFGKQNTEWIHWYVYERKSHTGEILKARNSKGEEICHNIESLWEIIQTKNM